MAFMEPAKAKSIWLKCWAYTINLDSAKERYSLTVLDKIYQGNAVFNPSQIDFSYTDTVHSYGSGGVFKHEFSIDRKTLDFSMTLFSKFGVAGDHEWKKVKSSSEFSNPKVGKCSIIKTPPTAGNKI